MCLKAVVREEDNSSPVGCCPAPALVIKTVCVCLGFNPPHTRESYKILPSFEVKFTSHISSNWIKTYDFGLKFMRLI